MKSRVRIVSLTLTILAALVFAATPSLARPLRVVAFCDDADGDPLPPFEDAKKCGVSVKQVTRSCTDPIVGSTVYECEYRELQCFFGFCYWTPFQGSWGEGVMADNSLIPNVCGNEGPEDCYAVNVGRWKPGGGAGTCYAYIEVPDAPDIPVCDQQLFLIGAGEGSFFPIAAA